MNNQIRRARKSVHITQEQLAKSIGINRATLSRYETGEIDPPLSQIQRIASALGVPVQDLIEDWSTVDKEEFKRVFIYGEGLEPKERIASALDKLNSTGAGKVADYAEDLADIPRYTAAPESTPPAPEGTDTTPKEKPPTGP